MSHKFQVHLSGIIDLLSNHLYSGPEVFVRELLQNGVDAIRARQLIEPDHAGQIAIELNDAAGKAPTVSFSDNGIGLTEDEVHRFLAIIGESSKRVESGERPADFIGQFGIGLLACFLVSDEIVVLTRSAKGGPAVEWRGKPDGTYTLKTLDLDIAPGTQVYLRAKAGREEFFDRERLASLARHYGGLLPFSIRLQAGKWSEQINTETLPWRIKHPSDDTRKKALLAFGQEVFEQRFVDAIPIRSEVGQVEGVAFILPHSPSLAAKRSDRVYLKQMLLSESAENLLPDWAFFVKAVVNANDLRPTASRESFYEDRALEKAREALGKCLRDYLMKTAKEHPESFRDLLSIHSLAIEALAVEDEDCFRVFVDWLPFETAEGRMTLPQFLERHDVVRFIADIDQFRQVANVASAQGIGVINAGYVYAAGLLQKYAELNTHIPVYAMDAAELSQNLGDLDDDEKEAAHDLLRVADQEYRGFRCASDLKRFRPAEMIALYSNSAEGRFLRSLEQSQESANPLWSGVLGNLSKSQAAATPPARLCFNAANPLVKKLIALGDSPALRPALKMLYVQSLLLAHQPLTSKEWALMNDGLIALVDGCLPASPRKDQR